MVNRDILYTAGRGNSAEHGRVAVDIIVNGSISELYYMDMKGMELAAAEDAVVQDNFSKAQSCLFAEYAEIRYYNVISQTVNLNDGEKQKQTDMLRMIHTGQ